MQIEGIEGLLRICVCQLQKKEGEHSCFFLEALVPEEKGNAYLQQVHKPIKVYLTEDSGEKGVTKQEASKWISDNIDDFKRIQIEVDGMTKVEQEEFGFL